MTNVKFIQLLNLPTTAEQGTIYYTNDGSHYIGKSNGSFLKVSDVDFLETLPEQGQLNKIYVHTQDDKVKLKIWSGTEFTVLNEDIDVTELKDSLTKLQEITTPYIPDKNIIFGQEYLSHFHKRIMSGSNNIITFSGDSTTNGYNVPDEFKINKLFLEMVKDNGFDNITTINRGFNNATVSQWANQYAQGDVASNPNLLIARWGINSLPERNPEKFERDMRNALTIIRNQKDVTQLSIVLMTPNSTTDKVNFRDMEQLKEINHVVRKLAREFRCVFIDTFALYYDSVNSHDWMDNMQNANIHLHPSEVMNLWITSSIFDTVFPSNIISKYGTKTSASNLLPKAKEVIIENNNELVSNNVEDAILELFQYANNGKVSVANAIGYPLNSSDTFSKMVEKITSIKSNIAYALSLKGIPSNSNESFDDYSLKIKAIPEISVDSGIKKVSKLNITAPYKLDIELDNHMKISDISSTLIEFVQGEKGKVYYNVDFNADDKSDFLQNENVIFDGSMKLKNQWEIPIITDTSWSDSGNLQYLEIDNSKYQSATGILIF